MFKTLNKKDILFYARIIPTTGIYEVCELTVRTVTDSWFTGMDKRDMHVYMFDYDDLGSTVFENRDTALKVMQKAENNKNNNISEETYYEEY
jgi:hypothetical protein